MAWRCSPGCVGVCAPGFACTNAFPLDHGPQPPITLSLSRTLNPSPTPFASGPRACLPQAQRMEASGIADAPEPSLHGRKGVSAGQFKVQLASVEDRTYKLPAPAQV